MPEGDTIFRAARTLHRALAGHTITHFESVFPRLSRIDTDQGIVGRTVERVEAHGKWLLIHLSGGLILLTHMLMNGSWHIYRSGEKWRLPHHAMRVVLATERFAAVAFKIQIAEFHTEDSLRRRSGFAALGPSLLDPKFDASEGVRRLQANPQLEVGDALLKQSVVAGVGNVFKSEVCFAGRVNPFRKVSSLSTEEVTKLISVARQFLRANVTNTTGFRRTTSRANPQERLWVYGRSGEPCRHCGTTVQSRKQGPAARTTFWCPQCQPSQRLA